MKLTEEIRVLLEHALLGSMSTVCPFPLFSLCAQVSRLSKQRIKTADYFSFPFWIIDFFHVRIF